MNLEIYTPPVFEIFMPCGKPVAGGEFYSARVRARKGEKECEICGFR